MLMQTRRPWPLLGLLTLALAACGDDPADSDADSGMGGEADVDGLVPGDTDLVNYACEDADWQPGTCAEAVITEVPSVGATHVSEPDPIAYDFSPPTSGPHRPAWGAWGEYAFLPPQRYLHNLEHGGVAFLYHPCAPAETVDALRALAQAQPADEAGDFRWILTPYPDLPTAIAVVAWEWSYEAECVDADAIQEFVDAHYRMAPEDVARDGSYDRLWIGR